MSSTTRALATQADLKELGDNIRGWHQQVRLALGNALSFAMDAGDALIAAQQRLPHGSWLPWLKNHCDLGERTAQLYMQLADGRATIESQIRSSAADLSLRAALRLIAPKKAERSARESTAPVNKSSRWLTASADLFAAWNAADLDTRQHFIDAIGLNGLLAAVPSAWRQQFIDRLADNHSVNGKATLALPAPEPAAEGDEAVA
jgi:DUF3102 family protein